jgi:spermine synthase
MQLYTHYTIILGILCLQTIFLFQCLGKKYDYVFGDLTDTPVSTTSEDKSLWTFLETIISLGTQLLKPSGKYMTHCNGKSAFGAVEAYESMLSRVNGGKCSFKQSEKFVPSFMEIWLFYQIQNNMP